MNEEQARKMAREFYYGELAPRMAGEPTPTNERAMLAKLEILFRSMDVQRGTSDEQPS